MPSWVGSPSNVASSLSFVFAPQISFVRVPLLRGVTRAGSAIGDAICLGLVISRRYLSRARRWVWWWTGIFVYKEESPVVARGFTC